MSVPSELSESVSKLVELSKQLSEAKSDIKILNQEEKRLKESVKKHMIDQGIDTINLRKGKISLRKSVRKSGINKDAIKELTTQQIALLNSRMKNFQEFLDKIMVMRDLLGV